VAASDNSTTYIYVLEKMLKLSKYHNGDVVVRVVKANGKTVNQEKRGSADPIEICERGRSIEVSPCRRGSREHKSNW
jgi:hypothetical protein